MAFGLLLCFQQSHAWVNHDDVTISSIIQFESGIGRDYSILEFSNNGARCRINHTDKELFSFALAAHLANKSVSVVCHDQADDPGASAYLTHKLHRIYTN